jgi:para-nitrobenzyl esterase
LPKAPIDLVRDGASKDVAVIAGSNKDETTLWGAPGELDEEGLRNLSERFGGGDELLSAYRSNRPDATPRDIFVAVTSDHTFRIPAIRLAEAREPHGAATWMYHFTWESRAFNGALKSTHALEIPFVFDNLDRGGVDVFLGEGPRPQHVADPMHAAWTSFIRTGDPSTETLAWPAYESDQRATMVFGDETAVANDPNSTEREAWAGRR